MDSVVSGGEASPLTEGIGILTADCEYDGVFQNLIDEDTIWMNRIDGEIEAELVLSLDDDTVNQRRLQMIQTAAWKLGFKAYARVFADLYDDDNVVTLLFTDDPSKGVIWALTEEMLVADWLN